MPDYKKMYFALAARVADAVELLVEAQREGEVAYIEDERPLLCLADRPEDDKDKKAPADP